MTEVVGPVVPIRIDLSQLVRRSVASLYSHLITRPTGQALRLGIESQIGEIGSLCLSVLDFSQVRVLDYSCADETVAKLILRYQRADRPADAYFVARGVSVLHRETIEEVLFRHDLALVVQEAESPERPTLYGELPPLERAVWAALEEIAHGRSADVANVVAESESRVAAALDALAERRVVVRHDETRTYYSIGRLLGD